MQNPDGSGPTSPRSINMNGAALVARGDETFGPSDGLDVEERLRRGVDTMRLRGYELDPSSPLARDEDTYPFRRSRRA